MRWLPEGWQDVGAVAGLIALVWNGIAAFKNRHSFRFDCRIMQDLEDIPFGVPSERLLAYFEVVNTGTKAGYLAGIHGKQTKNMYFMMKISQLPVKLDPGQKWNWALSVATLNAEMLGLWAEDTEGRKFRLPRKRLRALKNEVKGLGTK